MAEIKNKEKFEYVKAKLDEKKKKIEGIKAEQKELSYVLTELYYKREDLIAQFIRKAKANEDCSEVMKEIEDISHKRKIDMEKNAKIIQRLNEEKESLKELKYLMIHILRDLGYPQDLIDEQLALNLIFLDRTKEITGSLFSRLNKLTLKSGNYHLSVIETIATIEGLDNSIKEKKREQIEKKITQIAESDGSKRLQQIISLLELDFEYYKAKKYGETGNKTPEEWYKERIAFYRKQASILLDFYYETSKTSALKYLKNAFTKWEEGLLKNTSENPNVAKLKIGLRKKREEVKEITPEKIDEWITDEKGASEEYANYSKFFNEFKEMARDESKHYGYLMRMRNMSKGKPIDTLNTKLEPLKTPKSVKTEDKKEEIIELPIEKFDEWITGEKGASEEYANYSKFFNEFDEMSKDENSHYGYLTTMKQFMEKHNKKTLKISERKIWYEEFAKFLNIISVVKQDSAKSKVYVFVGWIEGLVSKENVKAYINSVDSEKAWENFISSKVDEYKNLTWEKYINNQTLQDEFEEDEEIGCTSLWENEIDSKYVKKGQILYVFVKMYGLTILNVYTYIKKNDAIKAWEEHTNKKWNEFEQDPAIMELEKEEGSNIFKLKLQ